MGKSKINTQHSASYAQMAELLSKAADTDKLIIAKLKTKVDNDDSYKAMWQLFWMTFAREWDSDNEYSKNELVRCQGWGFIALNDTTECPYEVISSETGLPIVNENYQLLTTSKFNEENWAKIDYASFPSYYELWNRMEAAEEKISDYGPRITALETLIAPIKDKTVIVQG